MNEPSTDTTGRDAIEPPVFTVVIPTYHREQQVLAAIRSALADELPTREVIVIDDAPDRSAERAVRSIGDVRVRYVAMPVPSGGRPALVRNYGISLARGRYLYFLDDDDQVVPGALGQLADALDRSDAAVAYGTVHCVGPDERTLQTYTRWFDWAERTSRRVRRSSWLTVGVILFRGTVLLNSACAIRRDAAVALGGYDADLDVYEDVDFFTRGIRRYGHVFVDSPVLIYSTGLTSIIHDLDGDTTVIAESNRRAHARYREAHGWIEYRVLQVVSKMLPIGGAARSGA